MTPNTLSLVERLKPLLAVARTPHDQSTMHGHDYDKWQMENYRTIVRELPAIIEAAAHIEALEALLGEIVAADDAALAEMVGLGLEPPPETRALTERARNLLSASVLSGDGG